MTGIQLDWSTAEVRDGDLKVGFSDKAPKMWREAFARTAALLSRDTWELNELKPGYVRISPIRLGDEERVKHFLEGAALEANTTLVGEEELFASEDADETEENDAAGPTSDEEMTARILKDLYRIEDLDKATRIYGVAGNPVSHSLSPLMQNSAFRRERINAVYLPLNTGYTPAELAYFVQDSEPRLFIAAERNREKIQAALPPMTILTISDDGRAGSLVAEAASHPADFPDVPLGMSDLASILYTSGTTGRSKGAMLSNGNLHSNAESLKQAWAFSPEVGLKVSQRRSPSLMSTQRSSLSLQTP